MDTRKKTPTENKLPKNLPVKGFIKQYGVHMCKNKRLTHKHDLVKADKLWKVFFFLPKYTTVNE